MQYSKWKRFRETQTDAKIAQQENRQNYELNISGKVFFYRVEERISYFCLFLF